MNHALNAVRIKPQITRKVIWRLAPLLILLYVVNQLDRANVGYAALTMNRELGMSVSQFGFAAGLFYAGYILVAVPSNLMLARFGARIWMTRILVTWGIVASLTAFVDSAHTLYVLRFLLGVAESGFFPGMVLYVTFWLPRQERVWLMSLLFLSIPLSNMLGAPISTFVMEHAHLFGWSGWRSMFFIEGLPAIALGVVTFVLMKDRPDDAAWLTADERAELNRALAVERQEANRVSPQSAWRALLDRRVLTFGLIYFGINIGVVALSFFLPQIVAEFSRMFAVKYSVFQIGLMTAIPFAVSAVTILLWGYYARRTTVSAWHVAIPTAVGGLSFAAALFMSSPYEVMAAFTLGAVGVYTPHASFWQLPPRYLSNGAAAAGIGLINTIGTLAGFLGPYATGWLHDVTGSYRVPMLGVAALMCVSATTVLLVERTGRVAAPLATARSRSIP
ncbi:MFS transporter [Paraburkholderia sp. 1N]|uniref:MFS transporter n=1 Tax=Paraburkholderia solitsugae TaxID=2675748 RepID=A0ABX2BMQ0_9BURK|nr:MFS transporter [Paraburkholderia solitsugae]NPT41416.1 MFS transporter [Paraburkholderia solitsugae]